MSAEPLSVITQPFRFGGWLDLAEVDSIGYATDGGLGGGGGGGKPASISSIPEEPAA